MLKANRHLPIAYNGKRSARDLNGCALGILIHKNDLRMRYRIQNVQRSFPGKPSAAQNDYFFSHACLFHWVY